MDRLVGWLDPAKRKALYGLILAAGTLLVILGYAPQVTVDLRFDHLRAPAPGRTVIGRGECYAIAHSVAYVRGVAYDGAIDDPIVHVAGSFMLLDGGAA